MNSRKEISGDTKQSKKSGKNLMLLGGAAVIVFVAVLVIFFTRPRTLNVSDYAGINVSGLNTEGKAVVSFDTEKLLADIGEKRDLTEREKETIAVLIEDAKKDFSLSKDSQLANGDEVTIKSNLNKNLLKDYGISMKNGSVKVSVADLIDIQEISLNDYISLKFNGFDGDGYGYAAIDYEKLREDVETQIREAADGQEADEFITNELDQYLYSVYVDAEQGEKLKNGDEVKMSIGMDNKEINQFGIRFIWEDISGTAEGLAATKTISATDYLDFELNGYDGAGYANVSMDKEKLAEDLQAFFEKEGRGTYGMLSENADAAQEASEAADGIRKGWRNAFTTELDKEEGLSNGDTVKVTSSAPEETYYFSNYGIYMEGGAKEIVVENLEEPQEIDLAEAVDVSFSGICPNVYVDLQIDYDLPYISLTSLRNMKNRERIAAKNGDTYSGEIIYDEQEMLENGYLVTNNKYSYTISGLNTYELSCTSLEDEAVRKISAELDDFVRETFTESEDEILGDEECWIVWNESEIALDSLKVAYRSDEDRTQNKLYLIYHAALPLKKLDRSIVQKDAYLIMSADDVEETPGKEMLIPEYWDSELCFTRPEIDEYIGHDLENMGSADILAEASIEEELVISAGGDAQITGEEAAEEQIQTGEFAENAKNQAAMILTYEGHTYARYDMSLPWDLANDFCQAAGGHLATITSQREKAVIDHLVEESSYGRYWLGASDATWEGGWQWITGEPFTWTDWDSGQPDNASYNDEGEENYLQVGESFGKRWNDSYKEEEEVGFILEIEPAAAQQEDIEYLSEVTPSAVYEAGKEDYVQDPYGNDYFGSLYLNASSRGKMNFDLNGEWSKLTGIISTWTEADGGCIFEIGIWGDGELLFSRYDYRKSDECIPFCINVEGVETLSIQTRAYGNTNNGYLFLNEGKLFRGDPAETLTERTELLANVPVVDARGYEHAPESGMITDIYGKIHKDAYTFYARDNGYVICNLDGAYTSMEAVLYAKADYYSRDTAGTMEVLLDGESVFKTDKCTIFGDYMTLSLDLTGKKMMEIRTESNPDGAQISLCLADTVLKKILPEKSEGTDEEEMRFAEIPAAVEQRVSGVVTCGNSRYYLFEEGLTWKQADAFCRAAGAVLACPTDAEENAALSSLISNGLHDTYWIGGCQTKRRWSWSDGADFGDYLNWADGQPDSEDKEKIFMAANREGIWRNMGSDIVTGYIMEVPAVSGQKPENTTKLSELEWTYSNYSNICDSYRKDENLPSAIVLTLGAVEMDASNNAEFTVNLNQTYGALEGCIGVYEGASDNVNMQLAIFGDGRLLYELRDIRKNMEDREYSIDVTGINVLTVATSNSGSYNNGFLYFSGELQNTEASEETENIRRLSDLILVDEADVYRGTELYIDAYGRAHDGFLEMNAGNNGKVFYNLEGKYTVFEGTITAGEDTKADEYVTIEVRADGEVIQTVSDFGKFSGPITMQADITDKKTLEIVAAAENETWIYLTDDQITLK